LSKAVDTTRTVPQYSTSGLGLRGCASGLLRQACQGTVGSRKTTDPDLILSGCNGNTLGSGVIPASNLTPPGDDEAGVTWANNDTTALNFKVCSGEGCAHRPGPRSPRQLPRQDDRARGRGHLYRRQHRLGIFRWQSHRRTAHRLGSRRRPRTWYDLHRLNGAAVARSAAGSLLATLRSDGQQTVDLHNGGRLAVFTLRHGLYREL